MQAAKPSAAHRPPRKRPGRAPAFALVLATASALSGCAAPQAPTPAPAPAQDPSWTAPALPADAREAAEKNGTFCTCAPPDEGRALDAAASDLAARDAVAQVLAHSDQIQRMGAPDLQREIARLSDHEEASAHHPLVLAAALAQTRQPADTARALGLVQRLLANAAPGAQALHPLARMLEARLLQQRRLEEQLERQAQQLRDVQRRNEQLAERLEAVRTIERSLTIRSPAAPPSSPSPAGPASSPARTSP